MAQRPAVGFSTAQSYRYMAALAQSDAAPLHGDCSDPVMIELRGQQSVLLSRLDEWSNDTPMDLGLALDHFEGWGWSRGFQRPKLTTAYVSVRCRKCTECLRKRAKLWTARAIDEIAAANRTWFGTLTLRPEAQFMYRMLADKAAHVGGSRWAQLTSTEQFKDIVKQVSPDLTKWIKRARKNSGATLRYLLVSEAHKSGDPHFHILLHEHAGTATKAVLEDSWKLGFSHWRLCGHDKKAAIYACKYLAKSAITRVRASAKYGTAGPRLMSDRLVADHAASLARERSTVAEKKRSLSPRKGTL